MRKHVIHHHTHQSGNLFGIFMFLVLFYSVGASTSDPVLSRFVEGLVEDPFLIGVLVSLSWIVFTIMAEPAGSVASKIGIKNSVMFGGLLDAFGFLLIYLADSVYLFALAMIIEGFGSTFFWSAARIHTARMGKTKKGRTFGFYSASWSIGWALGPIIGGTLAIVWGIRFPFLISGAILLLSVFVINRLMIKDSKKSGFKKTIKYELRGGFLKDGLDFLRGAKKGVRRILLSHIITNCASSILFVFIPLYFIQTNHAEIGIAFFIYSIVFAACSIFWGSLADKFRKSVFVTSGFLLSAGIVFFLINNIALSSVLVIMALLAVSSALIDPILVAMLNERVSRKTSGVANGLSQTSIGLGSSIGPIIGGLTASLFGLGGSFALAIVICLFGSAIALSIR